MLDIGFAIGLADVRNSFGASTERPLTGTAFESRGQSVSVARLGLQTGFFGVAGAAGLASDVLRSQRSDKQQQNRAQSKHGSKLKPKG